MIQPISRETAIALAKEAGMAGMLTDVVCSLEEIHRLCNLAVAHSRKDAEPVGYGLWIEHDGQLCLQWPVRPTKEKCQLDLQMYAPNIGYEIRAIFTHPPEADKLLQQALDALEDESLAKINNSIAAIRTYLEGKK